MADVSSSNFGVNCHSARLMTFFNGSSGETDLTEPEDASEVGTVSALPFWCISKPFTIFSMFFNSDAVEFLWTVVLLLPPPPPPIPFPLFLLRSLLLFAIGTCCVKADEDCCERGRWGDADWGRLLDGELEFALRLCDGLLLRLRSGGLSEFALDWPGVTASKAEAEPWWKPGKLYGENRCAFRWLWSGDVGEWPE